MATSPTETHRLLRTRHLQVLELAAEGLVNASIGRVLNYSRRTIEGLIEEARAELRATNRPHVVALAISTELIPPIECAELYRLTFRQRQAASALAHGLTAVEIGVALHLATPTVTTHLARAKALSGSLTSTHLAAKVASFADRDAPAWDPLSSFRSASWRRR